MMSQPHPYCAVTVVVVPLDGEGRPVTSHTTTLIGIAGVLAEAEEVLVSWLPDRETGTRFTVCGRLESI
jgi:hypothetical protein